MVFPADQTTRRSVDYFDVPTREKSKRLARTSLDPSKIAKVFPVMKRFTDQVYGYRAEFQNEQGKCLSSQEYLIEYGRPPLEEDGMEVIDVYSQNGRTPSLNPELLLTDDQEHHLFRGNDIGGMKRAANKLPRGSKTVVVLDLKDSNGGYRNASQIATAERVVCEFIKGPKKDGVAVGHRAEEALACFNSNLPVDYVLLEGRLKSRVLNDLTDEQAEFCLENPLEFCQMVEPHLTAVKFGHTVKGLPGTPELLTPVSSDGSPYATPKISTVYYPDMYHDVYGPGRPVQRALENVFLDMSFEEDERNRIIAMRIKQ